MTERVVRNESERDALILLVKARKMPFTMSIRSGAHRSEQQNRTQRMWLNEAAEQLGDQTAEELRGYCKLTIGVPIMREASEEFREKYDRLIKPHTYEDKLQMMMEPLDFPVTRIMRTSEKTRYLDLMYQHFSEQGVVLTEPKPRK